MQRKILAWVATLVGGTIVLALLSLLVITRSAARRSDIGSPKSLDSVPPAGLPGTTDAPSPPRDTTVKPEPRPDPNKKVANVGPLDRTLLELARGPRQRATLNIVVRKGLFYQVKEVKPDFMRVMVGSAFWMEPEKYRNPLMRDLYHAFNDGRPADRPYAIELWSGRTKVGEYVSDTFFWGPRYIEPR
jgi:hypothetical protein